MGYKTTQKIDIDSVMREYPTLNRLLRVMACRWAGASLATIAAQEGISRQRVHQILAAVGLSKPIRGSQNASAASVGRGASTKQVAQAIAALTHPLAHHLTARQRCALAWRAQGFGSVAIGRRMGVTPQAAIALESAAVVGLERTVFRRQWKEWAKEHIGELDQKAGLQPLDPVAATGNAATVDEDDFGDLNELLNTLLAPATAPPSPLAPVVPAAPSAQPVMSRRRESRRKG